MDRSVRVNAEYLADYPASAEEESAARRKSKMCSKTGDCG
jgi:hypothetical protein